MNREYHRWHSPSLGRDMELIWYGHYGRPLLAFPTSLGSSLLRLVGEIEDSKRRRLILLASFLAGLVVA